MASSNAFARSIRNFFRQWAADLNSGETYDAQGRVDGWHAAGYVQEEKEGALKNRSGKTLRRAKRRAWQDIGEAINGCAYGRAFFDA